MKVSKEVAKLYKEYKKRTEENEKIIREKEKELTKQLEETYSKNQIVQFQMIDIQLQRKVGPTLIRAAVVLVCTIFAMLNGTTNNSKYVVLLCYVVGIMLSLDGLETIIKQIRIKKALKGDIR